MSTITFDFRHHYQRGERRESEQIAYQWDLGHVMEVFVPEDATYTIGYCFGDYEKTEDYAIDTKVQDPDGGYKLTAHIPNKYFERSGELRVYVVGSADDHIITTYEGFITIRGRLMPDDYVDDDPENGATQIIEVAREYATKSESFAVGGTGTRLGEDTDNAKYYLEQAEEVAESIPEDYSELSADVDQLKNALTAVEIVDTASGAIASFADGSDGVPVKGLKVQLEPIQAGSGDPSPDNVRPISGRTEANVVVSPLNISQLYNGQIYGDGTWVYNSARLTNVQTAQSNVYFLKAGIYTLDFDKLNSNAPNLIECSLLTKDSNFNIVENFANAWNSLPFTFTLTQDGYLYFTARRDSSTLLNPSDYKAKILGQTYKVEFKDGDNPLTVYGGTLDVTQGVLTVDRALVEFDGSEDEAWAVTGTRQYIEVSDSVPGNFAETIGKYIANYLAYANIVSDSTAVGIILNNHNFQIRVSTDITTIAQLRAYLAEHSLEVAYMLETPITIQLSPQQLTTLLGQNNVWSDADSVSVDYVADTKLYIAKVIADALS